MSPSIISSSTSSSIEVMLNKDNNKVPPPDSPTGVMSLFSNSHSNSSSSDSEEDEGLAERPDATSLEKMRHELHMWKTERHELLHLRRQVVVLSRTATARNNKQLEEQEDVPEDELGLQLQTTEDELERKTNQLQTLQHQLLQQQTSGNKIVRGLEDQLEETTVQLVDKEEQVQELSQLLTQKHFEFEQSKDDLEFKIQFWKQKQMDTSEQLVQQQETVAQLQSSQLLVSNNNTTTSSRTSHSASLDDSQEHHQQQQIRQLETVLDEVPCTSLLHKIQALVDMVEQTKEENEQLKKEKLALMTRQARR
jgi:hypothetical protein